MGGTVDPSLILFFLFAESSRHGDGEPTAGRPKARETAGDGWRWLERVATVQEWNCIQKLGISATV